MLVPGLRRCSTALPPICALWVATACGKDERQNVGTTEHSTCPSPSECGAQNHEAFADAGPKSSNVPASAKDAGNLTDSDNSANPVEAPIGSLPSMPLPTQPEQPAVSPLDEECREPLPIGVCVDGNLADAGEQTTLSFTGYVKDVGTGYPADGACAAQADAGDDGAESSTTWFELANDVQSARVRVTAENYPVRALLDSRLSLNFVSEHADDGRVRETLELLDQDGQYALWLGRALLWVPKDDLSDVGAPLGLRIGPAHCIDERPCLGRRQHTLEYSWESDLSRFTAEVRGNVELVNQEQLSATTELANDTG